MSGGNPFGALFSEPNASENTKSSRRKMLSNVLGLVSPECEMDLSSLEHVLFERLIGENFDAPISYLIDSYFKIHPSMYNEAEYSLVKELINRNLCTAFTEPQLYEANSSVYQQFVESFLRDIDEENLKTNLIKDIAKRLISEGESLSQKFMYPILDIISKAIQDETTYTAISGNPLSVPAIRSLKHFLVQEDITESFLLYNFPKSSTARGVDYSRTLIGRLLTRSCIPESELSISHYFEKPSRSSPNEHTAMESRVWQGLDSLQSLLFDLFKSALKQGPKVKHLTLKWIGDCLMANSGRAKIWTNERILMSYDHVSDGFMMNLGAVLLRLCEPFTKGVKNPKMLKIDLTYTANECSVSEDSFLRGIHLSNLNRDTTLVPREKEQELLTPMEEGKPYNFITDIYFLTHKAVDLGFGVVQEKILKLNKELVQLQELHRNSEASPEAKEDIQRRMDTVLQKYLCLKAVLIEPNYLESLMHLTGATCAWLVHSALSTEDISKSYSPLSFPLPNQNFVSAKLYYIPEMIIENISEHLLVLRRFCPQTFENQGEQLPQIMDFILTFMGSAKWMKNPHLRAKMAENLECLLPIHELQNVTNSVFVRKMHREHIFFQYPHRLELIAALLHVFVSIETTGESVEFEQKFSYRRPMYDIMTYIWDKEEYRKKFVSLADEAEAHMEDENPPIFLRFVNLLINDANFLLDEALIYMKNIQEQQSERPSWESLPSNERQEREAEYMNMGRLARFHNIMGKETITVLDRLTSSIRSVFTHPTLADRIAEMLNHFLKNLVGPERKSFKVKNLDDYDFEPGEIVTNIAKIYVNYIDCKTFLYAVAKDGRSYSKDLFIQAEAVLNRIGKVQLCEELNVVGEKISKLANEKREEEELFANAPDEYLDPIMSILMRDPVTLPDSGQIVDRSTIARHLLSDQSDPFNRMPLSMDRILPNEALKEEIHEWMKKQKEAANQSS
uniref:Ubiquitin conjugation factor E4 A n=1 Tax=Lepeophtheirus salmonis TaxID=72036 RepID=A0A0K2VHY9_LEPSM